MLKPPFLNLNPGLLIWNFVWKL